MNETEQQRLYKLSHDIGVNFSTFKKQYSKYNDTKNFDEEFWIWNFQLWCDWLECAKDEYKTVKDFCDL